MGAPLQSTKRYDVCVGSNRIVFQNSPHQRRSCLQKLSHLPWDGGIHLHSNPTKFLIMVRCKCFMSSRRLSSSSCSAIYKLVQLHQVTGKYVLLFLVQSNRVNVSINMKFQDTSGSNLFAGQLGIAFTLLSSRCEPPPRICHSTSGMEP